MRHHITILILLAGLLMSADALAQFEIYGQMRQRAEVRHGYKRLPKATDIDPAVLVSQRSRLGVQYQKDDLTFRLSMQDVRAWGDDNNASGTGTFGNAASIDLYEAWFEWDVSENFAVRAGRQPWNYDDNRLLSNRNWNNNGLLYDAVLFKYGKNDFTLDIGASWNSKSGKDLFENDYDLLKIKTLNFLRMEKQFSSSLKASFITVLSGKQRSFNVDRPYMKSTTGAYLFFTGSPVDFTLNGYYQGGKNQAGADVNAWMLHASANAKLGKVTASAGLDMLSGTEEGDEEDKTFDPLYGARHKYYGVMDYFSGLPNANSGAGLNDIYLGLNWKAFSKGKLGVTYHYFAANKEPLVDGETYEKPLGSEIDFTFSKKLRKKLAIKAGYSFMMPQETLQVLKGAPDYDKFANWFWVMMSFKPTLFKSGN